MQSRRIKHFSLGVACITATAGLLSLGTSAQAETYSSNWGVVKINRINGNNWGGTYLDGKALLYGSKSSSGQFSGHWIRKDGSSRRCNYPISGSYYWGRATLQFSGSGFRGQYGNCDDEPRGNWSGEIVTQQPPQPQQVRLDGWWKGNNSGYYSIQTSGTTFQMKGFNNDGSVLNLYDGTIKGNTITGRWKNYCDNRSGNATLRYSNGRLQRIAGSTKNTTWFRSARPSNIQSRPNCN